ncbi:MAG: regulatory protein RecX [Endozoicomonas sp.]
MIAEDCSLKDVRRAAMDLLARREHSYVELERKLGSRFPENLVSESLQRLVDEGLQSDERFVESYVYSRQQRGYGPVRIRSELHQKGVDSELVAGFLFEEDETWLEMASGLRVKKFGEAVPRDAKSRAKQFRYLAQRGFSPRQIQDCFQQA